MQRSTEYQNLIKTKALEEVAATPGALALYLTNAKNYLASAKQIDQTLSMQVFTCAYEGYFQLLQAMLEFQQVRTKDAGRNLVIQRVSSDLKMSAAEFCQQGAFPQKCNYLGTSKSPKYPRHREAAGRGDPSSGRRSHGLPRYARNDVSE